jgi:hypothetical protein
MVSSNFEVENKPDPEPIYLEFGFKIRIVHKKKKSKNIPLFKIRISAF